MREAAASESPLHRPVNDAWPANMDRDAIVAEATNAVLADVAADLVHTSGVRTTPRESLSSRTPGGTRAVDTARFKIRRATCTRISAS